MKRQAEPRTPQATTRTPTPTASQGWTSPGSQTTTSARRTRTADTAGKDEEIANLRRQLAHAEGINQARTEATDKVTAA
eukprot:1331957-Alexandrium_andersonii.AAC.1